MTLYEPSPLPRGERFEVDLSSDEGDDGQSKTRNTPAPAFTFIGDIQERKSSAATPPAAPTFRSNATGFPAHKKRTRESKFKQQRTAKPADDGSQLQPATAVGRASRSAAGGATFDLVERQRIDEENQQKLSEMSPEEIEQEQRELFAGLNPALIEKLLKRARIDHTDTPRESQGEAGISAPEATKPAKPTKKVAFAHAESTAPAEPTPATSPPPDLASAHVAEASPAPSHETNTLLSTATTTTTTTTHPSTLSPTAPSIHFPPPPSPPPLDPTSPTFLTDLHAKHFPTLPHAPTAALSWLAPLPAPDSAADRASPYHPSRPSIPARDLRFSFAGALLPPRVARAVPPSRGLHHHADAPEAAGYTVPELARLARSRVPSQRCVAFQTLGRVLYQLGRGEFGVVEEVVPGREGVVVVGGGGDGDEDEMGGGEVEGEEGKGGGGEMAKALWGVVEEEGVIETLVEEANRETGHLSARSYAQEAVWNWRRGGGRSRRAI